MKKGARACATASSCRTPSSGENARLDYVVADKDVVFDMNRVLTGHQNYPVYVAKGSRV